jgi:thymidylate kinase
VVKKVVRIIKSNQQQHQPTTENEERLKLHQSILPLSSTQQQTFRSSELNALHTVEKIAMQSRVLIVEGISGSGKDTFQKYLKSKLRARVVHDYSEGELLLSWNQRPIKDIFKMQIRLMRNFLDYVTVTLERDDKAVFLLNRFHLSTYTMGVTEQPKLEREYNIVLKRLRTLPTHVFILQLMEDEIQSRSSHPERGAAWHEFQQHILEREGFRDFVKRNALLQKAMVKTAIRQNIPFSILRLPSAPNLKIAVRRSYNAKTTANLDAALHPLTQKVNPRRHPLKQAL